MGNLILLLDLDDVLNNQNQLWIEALNERHKTNLKYEDITAWDMSQFYPNLTNDELYHPVIGNDLVWRMSPVRDSVRITKEWRCRGHTIMIVTSTSTTNIDAKAEWLKKHYDWFTYHNLILTHKKQLVYGDILVDDGAHNLLPDKETGIKPVYAKLCFDKPWNRSFDCEVNGITRVHSFSEIDKIVKQMERGE